MIRENRSRSAVCIHVMEAVLMKTIQRASASFKLDDDYHAFGCTHTGLQNQ